MRKLRTIALMHTRLRDLPLREPQYVLKYEKLEPVNERPESWKFSHWNREQDPTGRVVAHFIDRAQYVKNIPCPYGQPGDRLEVIGYPLQAIIQEIKVEFHGSWAWALTFYLLTPKNKSYD